MQIPGRLPSKYQVATRGSGHSNCNFVKLILELVSW